MERRSWRPISFAAKHQVSPSFIYGEIRGKRLRARKAANGVTIITDEDEADWLNAMPTIGMPKNAAEPVNGCEDSSNNSAAVKAQTGPRKEDRPRNSSV